MRMDKTHDIISRIVTTHYQNIFSYVYRRTWDRDLAKDLTQETFYRFIDRYDSVSEKEAAGLLYRIAIHLVYDASKRKIIPLEIDVMDMGETPHDVQMRKSQEQRMRRLIFELPDALQDVIILRYYHNLTFKQIAQATGVNESTLKSREAKAKQILMKNWEAGETDE